MGGTAEVFAVRLQRGRRIRIDRHPFETAEHGRSQMFGERSTQDRPCEDLRSAVHLEILSDHGSESVDRLVRDVEGHLPEVGVRVMNLRERSNAVDPNTVDLDAEICRPASPIMEESRDCGLRVVDTTELQFRVRPALGSFDDICVVANPDGEGRVLDGRFFLECRLDAGEAGWHGREHRDRRCRLLGLPWQAEDPSDDVRCTNRDDRESRRGAGSTVRCMVDNAITAHCCDDGVSVGCRVGRVLAGFRRIVGPLRVDIERCREFGDHLPMDRAGEAGRRRVGEKEKSSHSREGTVAFGLPSPRPA